MSCQADNRQSDRVAVGAGWNPALAATWRGHRNQRSRRSSPGVDCRWISALWLLPKIAGPQQAKRLVLLAETIDAARLAR
jgi:2-(1,2-epoxy-1,2-dihydrophenyl)acetyl-CoA isomerase